MRQLDRNAWNLGVAFLELSRRSEYRRIQCLSFPKIRCFSEIPYGSFETSETRKRPKGKVMLSEYRKHTAKPDVSQACTGETGL